MDENGLPSDSQKTAATSDHLYHEKQRLQLCLLHALNSLFQRDEFTKTELDEIAETLHPSRWLNPHRSILGVGNYDVNVLIASLETRSMKLQWFDPRRSTACLNLDKIFGFIFNIKLAQYIPFWERNHWFAVRQIGDIGFFNFDSKLDEPVYIDNFIVFADSLLAQGSQMMAVLEMHNLSSYMLNDQNVVS